ncbi:VTT domain-containing protein [Candidatus Saccharibacteria bacterium]|jgi:membrane-associated protein|nr:VTT domain-containing protein [Candidatus Saccharibacteria bacterium]
MLDVNQLIQSGGILIIALIVFAESGLLIGFFLPGDSLLFAAGLYASQGNFSLFWLIIAIISAAVIGDNVGYNIGKKAGPRIFRKKDGIIFRKEYLQKAEEFYELHGCKTIIIARFTPIVRTFAPVVAGASNMDRQKFMAYNVIGGVLWGAGIPVLGYLIGNKLPHLDKYIEMVVVSVVVLSIVISAVHVLKDKETRTKIRAAFRTKIKNLKNSKNSKDSQSS